jgi:hypothetical protein
VVAHIPDPMLDWMHEKVNVSDLGLLRLLPCSTDRLQQTRGPAGAQPLEFACP